jgi:hypothetical protein
VNERSGPDDKAVGFHPTTNEFDSRTPLQCGLGVVVAHDLAMVGAPFRLR